nr:MAG TPA: hypothetical protein [Caudoviricetes sp.]
MCINICILPASVLSADFVSGIQRPVRGKQAVIRRAIQLIKGVIDFPFVKRHAHGLSAGVTEQAYHIPRGTDSGHEALYLPERVLPACVHVGGEIRAEGELGRGRKGRRSGGERLLALGHVQLREVGHSFGKAGLRKLAILRKAEVVVEAAPRFRVQPAALFSGQGFNLRSDYGLQRALLVRGEGSIGGGQLVGIFDRFGLGAFQLFSHGIEGFNVGKLHAEGLLARVAHDKKDEAVKVDGEVRFFTFCTIADFDGSGYLPKIGGMKFFRRFRADTANVSAHMVMPLSEVFSDVKGGCGGAVVNQCHSWGGEHFCCGHGKLLLSFDSRWPDAKKAEELETAKGTAGALLLPNSSANMCVSISRHRARKKPLTYGNGTAFWSFRGSVQSQRHFFWDMSSFIFLIFSVYLKKMMTWILFVVFLFLNHL